MTTDTQETLASGRELVLKHKLPLKILKCASDEAGLHFAYLSPEKTDLRPLSRDLNRHFKVKIQLEELTIEEAARLLPGYGPCGSRLCWLTDACENLWPCQFKEAKETGETQSEENPKGLRRQSLPDRQAGLRVGVEISENQPGRVGESAAEKTGAQTKEIKKKKLVRRLVLK